MAPTPIPPTTGPVTFLGIPPEIRIQIYKLVVTPFELHVDKSHNDGLIGFRWHSRNDCGFKNVFKKGLEEGEKNLLLTCKKVHKEVGDHLASRPVHCELHYHVEDAETLQPVRPLTAPGQALFDRVSTVDLQVNYSVQQPPIGALPHALYILSKYPSIRQIKYRPESATSKIWSPQKVSNIVNYLNNHNNEPAMLHFPDFSALRSCVLGVSTEIFKDYSLAILRQALHGTNVSLLVVAKVFIVYSTGSAHEYREEPMAEVEVELRNGQFQILKMQDRRDRSLKAICPAGKYNIHSLAERCTTAWLSSKTKDQDLSLRFWNYQPSDDNAQ